MQRPTDNLRADHAVTARGHAVLAAIAAQVHGGGDFPAEDCATLLRFLREFVLAVHLRKETDLVFPAVAMQADERAAAVVGELTLLQEEVTDLTHSLVLFWEPVGELTADERTGFAATVDALVARLRRMEELEETELFPACDAAVPADDQLSWLEHFACLERERGSRGTWSGRIRELADRWLP
jgi:hemerythrin-like domain-containing protein